MKKFEIHDLTTNEILSNNLNFNDMPELLGAYMEFYPDHEIIACYRSENTTLQLKVQKRTEFKMQWLTIIEEHICNFY